MLLTSMLCFLQEILKHSVHGKPWFDYVTCQKYYWMPIQLIPFNLSEHVPEHKLKQVHKMMTHEAPKQFKHQTQKYSDKCISHIMIM